jgi:hypothetical protein
MIFANDSLVGGGDVVAGLTLATTVTDDCLDANLFTCFFFAFVFVLSTPVMGEGGPTDA